MWNAMAVDISSHPGPVQEAVYGAPSFVSRAVFNGAIVCTTAPRCAVERALPGELRLASGAADSDWHPVLFIIGDQTRGASRVGGIEVEWGTTYQELVVAVPFVLPRRNGGLSVYAAAMFSNYYAPNWWGRVAFGYDKRLATLERWGPIQALTTPQNGLVFQIALEAPGPWQPADTTAEGCVAALRRMAALPWIGRKPNSRFVRSFSRWSFEGAQTRPVEAQPVLHHPIVHGLPTGRYEALRDASLEVRGMTWWLSWPRSCVL
jgi:hypothetical protein